MKQRRSCTGFFAVTCFAAIFLLVVCTEAEAAGYKNEVLGIGVSYSLPGCVAYYDAIDDTVTIEITQSGGVLKVKTGKMATFHWPEGWSDIFIHAPGVHLAGIKLSGKPATILFVCGQVGSCNKFQMKNGAVGGTDFYGLSVGLEATVNVAASKIIMKNGFVTGSLLGPPLGFLNTLPPVPGPSSAPGVEMEGTAEIKGLLQAESVAMDSVEKEGIIILLQDGSE